MNMRDFLTGLALGLAGKPLPFGVEELQANPSRYTEVKTDGQS